jgi:gas vesicle protein
MEDNNKLPYFFLGIGVGLAVGILFAPKSGEETRGLLKSKAEESKEFVKRKTVDLRDQAGDFVERGREAVLRQREQVVAAVEAAKQSYREVHSGATPITVVSDESI